MAQAYSYDDGNQQNVSQDYIAWGEAVADTAPALLPETLPPEFSVAHLPKPPAFLQQLTAQQKQRHRRRRIELPVIKR